MRRFLLAITTWEWLLLLFMLPLLLLPSPAPLVAAVPIPMFWLIRKVSTGRFWPPSPYNLSVAAILLALLIGITTFFDIQQGAAKLSGVLLGTELLLAVIEHCRRKKSGVWRIVAAVVLSGMGIVLLAIVYGDWARAAPQLALLQSRLMGQFNTVFGPRLMLASTVNLNELAGVMAWVVPLLIALAIGQTPKFWRSGWAGRAAALILTAAAVISGIILLATQSRGGVAATILAVLVMAALSFSWGRWLLLAGLLGGLISLFFLGNQLMFAPSAVSVETIGLQGRLEIWSSGIAALSDFPFTGTGLNNFRQLVHVLYPLPSVSPTLDIAHAHNHLLQAGLDLGIPGLVAYMSLWLVAAGLLWYALRQPGSTNHSLRVLQIGLAGSLSAGWLFGILDAVALG
ncbi:MAG: O-antigen ligase family protein, partial [Candidatus Promineifilaceae bacterium]